MNETVMSQTAVSGSSWPRAYPSQALPQADSALTEPPEWRPVDRIELDLRPDLLPSSLASDTQPASAELRPHLLPVERLSHLPQSDSSDTVKPATYQTTQPMPNGRQAP